MKTNPDIEYILKYIELAVSATILAMEHYSKNNLEEVDTFNNLNHPQTIGEMYEGLTRNLLSIAADSISFLNKSYKLNIGQGFIENTAKRRSKQIDIIAYIGEASPIPNTSKVITNFNNTIATIEVKKSLKTKEINEAIINSASIYEIFKTDNSLESIYNSLSEMKKSRISNAFKNITQSDMRPITNFNYLHPSEKHILQTLIFELQMPLRVAIGYQGYKTEENFKKYFCENLYNKTNENKGSTTYSEISIPDLIISGDYSIVKTNGLPIALQNEDSQCYHWLASSNQSPYHLLSYLLFQKIAFIHDGLFIPIKDFLPELKLSPIAGIKLDKENWVYDLYIQ